MSQKCSLLEPLVYWRWQYCN